MNTLEILKAGRAKITLPENFTTGAYARNSRGNSTCSGDVKACCWCSLGAIAVVVRMSVGWMMQDLFYGKAIFALENSMKGDIPDFSDSHTHAEVLAAWDAAIAEEEAK